MIHNVLFWVKSGANMFVTNKIKHFNKLIQKKIGVKLGAGTNSHFDGIGIAVVSSKNYPSQLIALCPTFFAPQDSIYTDSNVTLCKCCGFSKVVIDTGNNVQLESCGAKNVGYKAMSCDGWFF